MLDLVPKLETAPLFRGINSEDIKLLIECLSPSVNNYKAGDYVAIAKSSLDFIGMVVDGKVYVIKETAAGNRLIVGDLSQGDIFGEMGAFLDNPIWPASICAKTECTILFLAPNKLISGCKNVCIWHKMLTQNLLKIVTSNALMLNKKVEYLTLKGMREKISMFLLEQYEKHGNLTFTVSMNRDQLADYLNVSRPSMSREICRMKDEGLIDFHRSSFRIIDIDMIKRLI